MEAVVQPGTDHVAGEVDVEGLKTAESGGARGSTRARRSWDASEVANPCPDDHLMVDGQASVVQGEPERRDPDWLVWSLDARPT
jgi:hypothetical protein